MVSAAQDGLGMKHLKTGRQPAKKRCSFKKTGGGMMFEISGLDTSGSVKLKRASYPAALKKARELIEDGCFDVHIIDPDGRIYSSFEQEVA
jgi:hypothetical protein